MEHPREDVRCLNCGAYATEQLEKVAVLLDRLLYHNLQSSTNLDDLLELVDDITEAWKKV